MTNTRLHNSARYDFSQTALAAKVKAYAHKILIIKKTIKHILAFVPFNYTAVSKFCLSSSVNHFTAPYLQDICVCGIVKWSIIEARRKRKCVCMYMCVWEMEKEWEKDRPEMKTRKWGRAEWKWWLIWHVSAPLSTCSVSHVLGLVNCGATWLLCQSSYVSGFCSVEKVGKKCPTEDIQQRVGSAAKWGEKLHPNEGKLYSAVLFFDMLDFMCHIKPNNQSLSIMWNLIGGLILPPLWI